MSNSAPMRILKGQDPVANGLKTKVAKGAPVKSKAGKNLGKSGKAAK